MTTVDALNIVMEADTTDFQAGMKQAESSTSSLRKEQDSAAFQAQVYMGALEQLTSGLNGLVGGYSKSINAAKDLNMVSEEQYESLLRTQKQMELIIGPLELVISGFKIFNAVLLLNPIMLVVAAIALLIIGLTFLELKTGVISDAFNSMGEAIKGIIDYIESLADGLDNLTSKFDVIGDIGDRVSGYVGSIT